MRKIINVIFCSSIDWPIRYKVTIKHTEWNKRFHLQAAAKEPIIENECRECSAASINSKILWLRASRHSKSLQKKVLNIFFIILLSSIENLNDFTSLYIIMVLIMDYLSWIKLIFFIININGRRFIHLIYCSSFKEGSRLIRDL